MAFCFSELCEQSAETINVVPSRRPQLRLFHPINPSVMNLSIDELIELRNWPAELVCSYLCRVDLFWGGLENESLIQCGYFYKLLDIKATNHKLSFGVVLFLLQ